jgi:hypothetical protein
MNNEYYDYTFLIRFKDELRDTFMKALASECNVTRDVPIVDKKRMVTCSFTVRCKPENRFVVANRISDKLGVPVIMTWQSTQPNDGGCISLSPYLKQIAAELRESMAKDKAQQAS